MNDALNESTEFSVLLVDDDPQINDMLNQVTKSEFPQCRFIYKTSFEEATTYLDQLVGWAPRLVLLDIDLKTEKSGLDVLAWIRNQEQYTLLPIVVLSVMHDEHVVRQAYAGGANIFTNKPFSYTDWKEYVKYLRTYWFSTASTPKLWFDKPGGMPTEE
jgi:CheY-like chemotaxis protein